MAADRRDDESIDELIVRVREERGKSQYTLAEDLREACGVPDPGVDRAYVSRWENGRRIPTPYWRRHLSTVLDVPLEVLDRAAAVAKARRQTDREPVAATRSDGLATELAPAMALHGDPEASPKMEGILDLWDDLMRRRTFLSIASGGAVAPLVGGASGGQAPALDDVEEALAAYSSLTAAYRHLDGVLGPGAVYAQALEHHRRLVGWLSRTPTKGPWKQVAGLTTDASILVAWLHFDLEQFDQAARLYRETLDLATELDDVSLRAFLIGRMSRTLSECGRNQEALDFARAAQRASGTVAVPQVRSWLAVTRAYVHACLGEEHSCRTALEEGAHLLSQTSGPTPPYVAFYGQPYLHKWSGHALLRLAERQKQALSQGREVTDQALAIWSRAHVRESGEVLAACARARLAAGQVDEAARLTGRAYDVATSTASPRVLRYVSGLRQELSPYRHTRAVRRLDEHMLTGR